MLGIEKVRRYFVHKHLWTDALSGQACPVLLVGSLRGGVSGIGLCEADLQQP